MNVLKRNPPVVVEFRLPHPAGWEAAPVVETVSFWDGGQVSNMRYANGLARELAEAKEAPEVWWKFVGESQVYYARPLPEGV